MSGQCAEFLAAFQEAIVTPSPYPSPTVGRGNKKPPSLRWEDTNYGPKGLGEGEGSP